MQNRIIITATFTAEPVNESLSFLLQQIGNDSAIEFTAHNQAFQQLLDPNSITRSNQRGVNVFLIRFQDWLGVENTGNNPERVFDNLKQSVTEFIEALNEVAVQSGTPLLIIICPSSVDMLPLTAEAIYDRMDDFICQQLRDLNGVHVVSSKTFTSQYSRSEYEDLVADQLGRIPYTQMFYAVLGSRIARMVYGIQSPPRKVIVLDCDQTLWLGICGEDGPKGVELDQSRRALQEFMVEQHDAGRLLCICSKNNEEDVFAVFSERNEMPLRLNHFAAWRINWNPKSENLKSLAAELNLSLESFVFVDDDPVVCAEVEANCPEVLSLQLPGSAEAILPFLQNVWAFDHLKQTNEDRERTRFYRAASVRDQLRTESSGLADFVRGLNMTIEIQPLSDTDIPRVAQLTQRTNQFNFTTERCSESHIGKLRNSGFEFLVVRVRDRFGDYGIVGALGFHQTKEALEVKTFLLSCRAFGRGIEHKMLARLGELCIDRQIAFVDLHYRKSDKNAPATQFVHGLITVDKRTTDDEQIFRLTAQSAFDVKPDGDFQTQLTSLPVQTNGQKEFQNAAKAIGVETSLALNAVALHLSKPDQIIRAIQIRNQRSAAQVSITQVGEFEAGLTNIWESILGIKGIGLNDSFFEIGGDSFKAVHLFSELEKRFARRFPLDTLLHATTIAQLAALLRQPEACEEWSPLVPLQSDGSRPPFYCIHAAGGSVLFYRDLIKYLGVDQPLYGLQARGMNRGQTTHDSVEEMAAYYLEAIRAFQPEGPYYLAGSSFGGLVGFEMACQLERAGEEVALLGLLDTYGPNYPQRTANGSVFGRLYHRWADRVYLLRENLSLMDTAKRIGYLSDRVTKIKKVVQRQFLWQTNNLARKVSSKSGASLPRDLQANHKAIERAEQNYKPKSYNGLVTLFRASRQPSGILPDPYLGWKEFALGGIEIFEVRGLHGAVTVDPHAAFLAEQLVPCLRHAQLTLVNETAVGERLPSSNLKEPLPVMRKSALERAGAQS